MTDKPMKNGRQYVDSGFVHDVMDTENAVVSSVERSLSISHHVDRTCVVGRGCTYVGPNLKRHLTNVHVKKGHILLEQVGKFFSMGLKGHKRRGPPRKTKSERKIKGQ